MFMFVHLGAMLLYRKLSADDRFLPMQAIARRMPLGDPCRITLAITWPQGLKKKYLRLWWRLR
jgi:hypothetical protein